MDINMPKMDGLEATKIIVDKIKNLEIKQTEHRAKTTKFKNANKEILQTQNKLRKEYWKLSNKKHNHLKQLGIFQSPNYCLPSLIINNINY